MSALIIVGYRNPLPIFTWYGNYTRKALYLVSREFSMLVLIFFSISEEKNEFSSNHQIVSIANHSAQTLFAKSYLLLDCLSKKKVKKIFNPIFFSVLLTYSLSWNFLKGISMFAFFELFLFLASDDKGKYSLAFNHKWKFLKKKQDWLKLQFH